MDKIAEQPQLIEPEYNPSACARCGHMREHHGDHGRCHAACKAGARDGYKSVYSVCTEFVHHEH